MKRKKRYFVPHLSIQFFVDADVLIKSTFNGSNWDIGKWDKI